MTVELTRARLKQVLHYDPKTGVFTRLVRPPNQTQAGSIAGWINPKGYRDIRVDGRSYRAHRLAWFYMTGKWSRTDLDHINRDKTDNRFVNLREATRSQNSVNSKISSNNTSGVRGVYFDKRKKKFRAQVVVNGKCIAIGLHRTVEDAAKVATALRKKYYGEFAP